MGGRDARRGLGHVAGRLSAQPCQRSPLPRTGATGRRPRPAGPDQSRPKKSYRRGTGDAASRREEAGWRAAAGARLPSPRASAGLETEVCVWREHRRGFDLEKDAGQRAVKPNPAKSRPKTRSRAPDRT